MILMDNAPVMEDVERSIVGDSKSLLALLEIFAHLNQTFGLPQIGIR
jgi:hypothetical protein